MAKKVAKLPFDPAIFLATVDSGRTLSDYRRNDVIFTQGDPADAVFYIKTGKVKITVISEQGKEAVVAVLGFDEFCGEGCLAGQARRMATATAMSECGIMRLEKAAIIGVLHDEPGFSEMFVSHLLARTIRVEEDLVCSIQARSAWHGLFFCWQILARTVDPSRLSRRSAKRRSRR
jgi:CRP/FNR family cyclic AMP-dependent transcriptional regulator